MRIQEAEQPNTLFREFSGPLTRELVRAGGDCPSIGDRSKYWCRTHQRRKALTAMNA